MRIGLSQAPREIDIDVDDQQVVVDAIEKAVGDGQPLVWILDQQGRRYGVMIDKIAYVQVDSENDRRGVGFSSV